MNGQKPPAKGAAPGAGASTKTAGAKTPSAKAPAGPAAAKSSPARKAAPVAFKKPAPNAPSTSKLKLPRLSNKAVKGGPYRANVGMRLGAAFIDALVGALVAGMAFLIWP